MSIFNSELVLYLISAMIAVESGGDDNAYNPNEQAVGCLQIRQIYLDEIERVTGKQYALKDMHNRALAIEATYSYFLIVAKQIQNAEKREVSLQDLARSHNGGPDGYKEDCTRGYWEKVRVEYNKLTEFIDI